MGGTPYLWQRDTGIWCICWDERTVDNKWRTRRISCRTTDRSKAEAQLAQYSAGSITPAIPERPNVSAILDGYLADLHARQKRSEAADWASKPLKEAFGLLMPEHLTKEVVRAYIEKRRALGRSDGTIRRELAGTLRTALSWAEREKWVDKQPHIEAPSEPHSRDQWLTREQFDRLAEECLTAPHLRLFAMLALNTAARTGAMLDLTWDRVDFDKRLVDYGAGHGNKHRAIAPINDDLLPELLEAYEARTCEFVIEYHSAQVGSVKAAFKRAAVRAGIPWAHPHLLRHTAATWMIEAGVPLREAARMLGDSEEMVERRYGKHSPSYLRNAANALQKRPSLPSVRMERDRNKR